MNAQAQAAAFRPTLPLVLRLRPRVWLVLGTLLALGVAGVLVSEWSSRSTLAAAEQLARAQDLRRLAHEYLINLVDAETGQRGYLLSGDKAYLRPLDLAIAGLPGIASDLRAGSRGDPEVAAAVAEVDTLRADRMSELRATVLLAQNGQRPAALRMLRSDRGQVVMDRLRERHVALLRLLDRRIQAHERTMARGNVYSRLAFAVLGLLALSLTAAVAQLLLAEYRSQDEREAVSDQERRRLEEAVAERTRQLFTLTTHLQTVAEEEKRQVAHELHDELGGLLTAAKMDLAWVNGKLDPKDEALQRKLRALGEALDSAMSVKRRITSNLRPSLLEHFGFTTALESHYSDVCEKAELDYEVAVAPQTPTVPKSLALPLFRIAQEALTNVVRHARARKVSVALSADRQWWHLRVRDDGIGIDPEQAMRSASHGLAGMRHRAQALGGHCTIERAAGGGTEIRVALPRVNESEAGATRDAAAAAPAG